MVLYTVRLTGPAADRREVRLIYKTVEGEEHSTVGAEQGDLDAPARGKTDHTGVITIWGPWSPLVRVLVDGQEVAEIPEWTERPADRYTEIEAPPRGAEKTALSPSGSEG